MTIFNEGDRVRITCFAPAVEQQLDGPFGHIYLISDNGAMTVQLLNGKFICMLQPTDLEHVD